MPMRILYILQTRCNVWCGVKTGVIKRGFACKDMEFRDLIDTNNKGVLKHKHDV